MNHPRHINVPLHFDVQDGGRVELELLELLEYSYDIQYFKVRFVCKEPLILSGPLLYAVKDPASFTRQQCLRILRNALEHKHSIGTL